MCMFYSFSWIIFLNLRVTDQCQDRPSTLQHLSDLSKMFFYSFMGTASLRVERNVSGDPAHQHQYITVIYNGGGKYP